MIGVVAAVTVALLSASVPPTSTSTSTPSTSTSTPPTSTTSPATSTSSAPKPVPPGFVGLVDDTGRIVAAVPEAWNETDTAPRPIGDATPRPYIAASPDIDTFFQSFEVPGMAYVALPFAPDPLATIEQYGLTAGCQHIQVRTYEDTVFTGVIQIGTGCGPHGMIWNMVAANPADQAFTALLQVQSAVDRERQVVLRTFNVTPDGAAPSSSAPASSMSTTPSTSTPTSTPAAATSRTTTAPG